MLPRAVNSVLAQTFADFELLIVDDCSADETPDVVARLVNADPRIRSLRHCRNRGLSATRNAGISRARGEYIAFLDDDDEYLPTKIEKQVRVLDAASTDVGMVYVWLKHIGPSGEEVGTMCGTSEGHVFDEALAMRVSLTISLSAMFRRSVFDTVGRFDETMSWGEDQDFSCRVTKHFKIAPIPQFLARYHVGHPSMSETYNPSKQELIRRRDLTYRHQAKYGKELASRRRVRSAVWRRLAILEWRIGNHTKALRATLCASVADPSAVPYVAWRLIKRVFRRSGMP